MNQFVVGLMSVAAALSVTLLTPTNGRAQPPGQPGSQPAPQPEWSNPAELPRSPFPGPGMPFGQGLPPLLLPIDQNGDGQLSAEEIENSPAILKRLDRNGDGVLTVEELVPEMGVLPPGGPGFGGSGFGGPGFGGPGFGGPDSGGRGFGGPGGPGGPMMQEQKLVKQFDENGDGWLDAQERQAARQSLANAPGNGRRSGPGSGPPGGPRGRGNREPAQPGPQVSPTDVASCGNAPLYDPSVLRTLFLDFENDDWEAELSDFKNTDVDVTAKLTVDGMIYPNVGVHFRGMSSYMMAPEGYKRSLNVSLDLVDSKQRLYGYKTLNLLNCSGDASLMSTVLYSHIARQHIPAPKANFVKVVINGESWGIYANVQQFNKEFVAENFTSDKGRRWKASGSPGADGGLRYLGENIEEYRRRYEIKSKDDEKSWQDLIRLCRTLNETPTEDLEQALAPMLDIDRVLWFLALDVTLVNSDGYWTRASDYSILQDEEGVFHIIPHDMNEAFHGSRGFGPGGGGPGGGGPGGFGPGGFGPGGGGPGGFDSPGRGRGRDPGSAASGQSAGARRPGGAEEPGWEGRRGRGGPGFGPGGPGGRGAGEGGVELDPLVALEDPGKPLRSRLLAVPGLRAKYLQYVRTLADSSLDWNELGPLVAQYRALIKDEVSADTRKLSTTESFLNATSDGVEKAGEQRQLSLRDFAEQRREYLLKKTDAGQSPEQ